MLRHFDTHQGQIQFQPKRKHYVIVSGKINAEFTGQFMGVSSVHGLTKEEMGVFERRYRLIENEKRAANPGHLDGAYSAYLYPHQMIEELAKLQFEVVTCTGGNNNVVWTLCKEVSVQNE